MLTSLSFIFLVGLAMAAICQRIRLPRIIGMLLAGASCDDIFVIVLFSTFSGMAQGRQRKGYGFCKYPHFHCERNPAGCCSGMAVKPVF